MFTPLTVWPAETVTGVGSAEAGAFVGEDSSLLAASLEFRAEVDAEVDAAAEPLAAPLPQAAKRLQANKSTPRLRTRVTAPPVQLEHG